MGYSFDAHAVQGFGSLDASQIARMDAVVEKARKMKDEAWSLVPGMFSSLWSTAIGASSTVSALQTNAKAASTLYEAMRDKRDRLAKSASATEYDVIDMERTAASGAFSNEAAKEAAYLVTPGAAIAETAKGTAQDIASAVKNPLGIPLWGWGVGAAAILLLIVVPKFRR